MNQVCDRTALHSELGHVSETRNKPPRRRWRPWVPLFLLAAVTFGWAQEEEHRHHSTAHGGGTPAVSQWPADCSDGELWEPVSAMCMPKPTGRPMTHVMLHGNVFGVLTAQEGGRGEDGAASTQMLMANLGRTLGARHYLNLGVMATFEKWTLPSKGYPLLLQTGEANRRGEPYVDAQHPHSSPLMGLTLSDTIRLSERPQSADHVRLFFSPRGQSTDGPITFMHRPTGVPNPDAPLGHHLGQDVGHITSTVLGGSLRLGRAGVEVSGFHGAEPQPDEVDLPIGGLNSVATRLIGYFSPHWLGMASFAYVGEPHADGHAHGAGAANSWESHVTHAKRYSASLYAQHAWGGLQLHNTWIYGAVQTFGPFTERHSASHEFFLERGGSGLFGRTEVLERLPAELLITNAPDGLSPRWVTAATLGYTHVLKRLGPAQLSAGLSATKNFVPNAFHAAYGGDPWSGKIFLRLSGMQMWAW